MSAVIEHNRRAVYTALSGVCEDRLLLERAFAFWETNFASQAVFRVAQYIDGLMGHVGLNQDQRRSLSVALYAALNKADRELSDVPAMFRAPAASPVASAPASPTPARTVPMSAASTVLSTILAELVVGATRAGKLDDLIAEIEASRDSLGTAPGKLIGEWVKDGLANCDRVAARTQNGHGALINFVYVAMCEALGPVTADRVLSRAVSAAEQLPEAVEAPPRAML